MSNQRKYTVNGIEVKFLLETANHMWLVYADSNPKPIIVFTKAKGDAVIRFLEATQKELE